MKKQIKAHGARLAKGNRVIVPLMDGNRLVSLQSIAPDGEKRFFPGGSTRGYYVIGEVADATWLCVCEGFATGASVHEATGYPVAVAFSAANLLWTASKMRERFPSLTIVIAADDDHRTNGNPGVTRATEAARSVGGLLAIPDFGDDRSDGATDFNDLSSHRGHEAVRDCVESARRPEAEDTSQVTPNTAEADPSESASVESNPRDNTMTTATNVPPRKTAPPAFQIYAGKMLANKNFVLLSSEQRGLYFSMLCAMWESETIPDKPESIARLIGLPVEEVTRALPAVRPLFKVAATGELCDDELIRQRERQDDLHARKSKGGKRAAQVMKSNKPAAGKRATGGVRTGLHDGVHDGVHAAVRRPADSGVRGGVRRPVANQTEPNRTQPNPTHRQEEVIHSGIDNEWEDGVDV